VLLLDTNIAIALRDRHDATLQRYAERDALGAISLVTLIELKGGLGARPELRPARTRALDGLLRQLTLVGVDERVADAYGSIVQAIGFSRRLVFDRLIAATAIVHDLPLATANPADFADIPGLAIEPWPAAQ